jgi:DNA polymerase-1
MCAVAACLHHERDAVGRRYPGIADYMERAKESARQNGYVETLFGRRCYIPNIMGSGSSAAYAGRKAINAPIQGTAADVIKVAMVRMEEALDCAGLKTRMLLQVHDELLFEVSLAHQTHSVGVSMRLFPV